MQNQSYIRPKRKITKIRCPNRLNNFDLGKFIKMTLLESNFKANIKGTGFNPKNSHSIIRNSSKAYYNKYTIEILL
jgi:hypothetical protein